MGMDFSARQNFMSKSELEQLLNKRSSVVDALAWPSGSRGVSGQQMNVGVGTALNMLILSTASDFGFEIDGMAEWLPVLRNEAIFVLGCNLANWAYEGPDGCEQDFWSKLYGTDDTVRRALAGLLRVSEVDTARQLRFHSQIDVEVVSSRHPQMGHSGRTPIFVIDAHRLAERVQMVRIGPLFTASLKTVT